ncbi:MAG: hypothetical protein HQM05_17990, partial [Magnetococcales bacterium]|nr:hypothetical protein [Magnetococcales bacterium]
GPAETLGDDAVGFLLSGVEFGLVVATEREVLTQTLVENQTWKGVAVSDYRLVDGVRIAGSRQVAISNGATGSNIWISEDQGLSWQAVSLGAQGLNFSGVTISKDGQEIVCVVADGGLLLSRNGGRDWFYDTSIIDSYTAVALTPDGGIITADQRSRHGFDVLTIVPGRNGGSFAVGDTITIKGLSTANVVYTVVAADLTSDGASSTSTATVTEASTNIAKKLAKALNDAAGGLATATANGASIELVAKGSGSQSGWYGIEGGVKSSNGLSLLLLNREAIPGRGIGQRDVFKITGSFAVGDVIAMAGISSDGATLYYTVQDIDLKVDRKTDGKTATTEHVWANVMKGIKSFFDEPFEIPKTIARLQADLGMLVSLNLFGILDDEVNQATAILTELMHDTPAANHSTVVMAVVDGVMLFTGYNGNPPYHLDITVLDSTGKVKTGNTVLSSEGNTNQIQRGNLRSTASLQDQVNITGTLAEGDVIILEGITADRPFLSYTVSAADLLVNGVAATPEQVWTNVMAGFQNIFNEPAERVKRIDTLREVLDFLRELPPTLPMDGVVHTLEASRNELLGNLDILSRLPADLATAEAVRSLEVTQDNTLRTLDFLVHLARPDHPVLEAVQGMEERLGTIDGTLASLYPLPHTPEVVAQVLALESEREATLAILGVLQQFRPNLQMGEAVQSLQQTWEEIPGAMAYLTTAALPAVGAAVSVLEGDRDTLQRGLDVIYKDTSAGFSVFDAVISLENALGAVLAYQPPAQSSIVSLQTGAEGMLFSSLNGSQSFNLKIQIVASDGRPKTDNQVVQNTLQPVRPYLPAGQWSDEHWTSLAYFDSQQPGAPVTHALLAAAGAPVLGNGPSGLYLATWSDAYAPVQWQEVTPPGAAGMEWTAVAVNGPETGKVMVAVGKDSQIYINQPGKGWHAVGASRNWRSVAIAEDGKTIVAAASGSTGGIWASNDCGVTWRLVHGSEGLNWSSLALTSDGQRLT